MAAISLPRRLDAWRVDSPLFEVSLCGGLCNLRSIWLDVCVYMDQGLLKGKVLKTSAVACTTCCLAASKPPYGLANVNP